MLIEKSVSVCEHVLIECTKLLIFRYMCDKNDCSGKRIKKKEQLLFYDFYRIFKTALTQIGH